MAVSAKEGLEEYEEPTELKALEEELEELVEQFWRVRPCCLSGLDVRRLNATALEWATNITVKALDLPSRLTLSVIAAISSGDTVLAS